MNTNEKVIHQLDRKLTRHLRSWSSLDAEPSMDQVNEYIVILEDLFEGRIDWPDRVCTDWQHDVTGEA